MVSTKTQLHVKNVIFIIFFICACFQIHHHHHHHYATILSCGWTNVSICCIQICLSCAILCQMVSFQYAYSCNSSLPSSRRSSSRSFPFVRFPGGDTRCPSIISYCNEVPCSVHFRLLTFHIQRLVKCQVYTVHTSGTSNR